ncbi:unnamed protein product [Nesidiocoris tenuis]|uniref:Uncharacterized protein n=1 Tax=Nesidiocoris tenuis TaxID=355587 RepID=A0A6H5H656_9HEMI|nr:unnamed protein product [Nesidiocoris tenuis]
MELKKTRLIIRHSPEKESKVVIMLTLGKGISNRRNDGLTRTSSRTGRTSCPRSSRPNLASITFANQTPAFTVTPRSRWRPLCPGGVKLALYGTVVVD